MRLPHSHRARSVSFRATPLIDMAFLLITFFIMSIRFGQAGEEQVKLPNADQAKDVTDERVELVTVNITADGLYLVSGVHKSGGELFKYLQARKAETRKELEIVIRGDRKGEFGSVQRVMRLTAEAGITNVSLAALQSGDDTEP